MKNIFLLAKRFYPIMIFCFVGIIGTAMIIFVVFRDRIIVEVGTSYIQNINSFDRARRISLEFRSLPRGIAVGDTLHITYKNRDLTLKTKGKVQYQKGNYSSVDERQIWNPGNFFIEVQFSKEIPDYADKSHYVIKKYLPKDNDSGPTISNINVSNITTDSVDVSWITDKASTTEIEYGPSNVYGATVGDPNLVQKHNFPLNNLFPNTTYYFIVRSTSKENNRTLSVEQTFMIPDLESNKKSDLIITDIKFGSSPITFGDNPEDNIGLVATVKNLGHGDTSPEPPVYLEIYYLTGEGAPVLLYKDYSITSSFTKTVYEASIKGEPTPLFKTGEEIEVYWPRGIKGRYFNQQGNYEIRATIDPEKEISEINEENNFFVKKLSI